MAVRAYLGLGSNVGDRLALLQRAVDHLTATRGVRVLRSSRVYETDPVGGPPAQPDFLNAVIEVETDLSAMELLRAGLAVEERLKRSRSVRWGPRTVDIDVLTYGREEIDGPGLVVPHPRMHERAFVIVPLLELDPNPPLPGGRGIGSLRLPGADPGSVRPFAPPLAVPSQAEGGRAG
jgi:2-amino-4-hydroxy-6-hydroxymethyldihydropteridine diphosphokinase